MACHVLESPVDGELTVCLLTQGRAHVTWQDSVPQSMATVILWQSCQTHFHQGPRQPHSCL